MTFHVLSAGMCAAAEDQQILNMESMLHVGHCRGLAFKPRSTEAPATATGTFHAFKRSHPSQTQTSSCLQSDSMRLKTPSRLRDHGPERSREGQRRVGSFGFMGCLGDPWTVPA